MAKRPSMDTIKTPDLNNLDAKQSKVLNTFDRYTRAEDYSGKVRADFSRAQKVTDFELKSLQEEKRDKTEVLVEEFSAKKVPTSAANAMNKGVKVRGKYVARKKIIAAVVIAIAIIVFITLFVPPIYFANDAESSCRKEDIFAESGATQFRADIMNNNHVYNVEALSSDRSDSYRICTVAFDVKNWSPFTFEADDYVISNGGDFDSHIVYSTAVGDSTTIPAFTNKTIQIEILINKDGLSDEEFDRAITSLTISTAGAEKKISKNGGIPCIPAFMNVSDVITFDPDA